ncbi:MAG: PD-(D/E)XK nuclease domain-containing protein [Thiolinea sp.]
MTLKLDSLISSSSVLSSFDVDRMTTEALLFQTGYLTIRHQQQAGGQVFYTLGYPNQEVYQSLNESLLAALVQNDSAQSVQSLRLYQLLLANDFNGLKQLFHAFFASIPYAWYTNTAIQNYEGYYASVFYSYFASLGLDVTVEDMTNLGRIDMTLKFNRQVYIFEFKVVELVPEGKALQQIKDKGYADKYRAGGQSIHLIGVEFSKDERNIVAFEVETETT